MASTAARADAFLLPDSLQFAEYNAERPAGAGYSQRLAELFDGEPLMDRFRERFDVRHYTPIPRPARRAARELPDWGGTANLPRIAIVDWREVPTWSEFELLRDAFTDARRSDRDLRSARPGLRRSAARRRTAAHRSGLPPRPHQRHRRARRTSAARSSTRTEQRRRLRGQQPALQDCAQEGVLRRPDRRAVPAPLRRDDRATIAPHVPWTRVVRDTGTTRDGRTIDLLGVPAPPPRPLRAQAERRVRRHRRDARLGDSRKAPGTRRSRARCPESRARLDRPGADRDPPRDLSRLRARRRSSSATCSSTSRRISSAARVAGFLTRLSATGLANVTSGGGQVPAFVVSPQESG